MESDNLEGGTGSSQIAHLVSGFMRDPMGQLKERENAREFITAPNTRAREGLCGSTSEILSWAIHQD
jgi:hypothetical protein